MEKRERKSYANGKDDTRGKKSRKKYVANKEQRIVKNEAVDEFE